MMKKNSDNSNKNDFYITLKNERNYYQGDVISGAVVLDLQSVKKIQNVKIMLEGIAFIHNKPTTIYSTTQTIMEPPAGEKFVALDAHTHTYNFHLNAPASKALPSTLDIPDLMTVQYRLIAIQQVQFGLLDFSKVHPTYEKEVNILERIDVNEFTSNYGEIRDIALVGLEKKVRVAVDVLKCAAVKGATIPISITINHVGVMVKDRAIRVRLFRNVFYQNTRLNLDGPELITSTNGDIMIIGPTEFTSTTRLKLVLPSKICPTVEETGKTFKVEYLVNIIVNLNEQSPHLKEREEEIVIFDIPFTIGTYPQLDYCIDDDDDDDEDNNINSSNNNINNNHEEEEEEEQEEENVTMDTNQTLDSTENVAKALDQVNIESSSGHALPEVIIQQQEKSSIVYKPDEIPDEIPEQIPEVIPDVIPEQIPEQILEQIPEQINPPVKQRTTTYESSVQLPEFIDNEPMLPEQILENDPENNQNTLVKNKKEQEPVLPQKEDERIFTQKEQEESLPIELPSDYNQKEKERPIMKNVYSSSSSSCTPSLSSETTATYFPTPSSSSRPSSPSLTYQVSPPHTYNRTSSNASLPIYNSDINKAGGPDDDYQLPTQLDSSFVKRSSYLSMNDIPPMTSSSINRIDHNSSMPAVPPRHHSPRPTSFNGDHFRKASPPIPPPRTVSSAYNNNKPPLPPRNNMVSNNNNGYGQPSPPPPPPQQQQTGMPQAAQYQHSVYTNFNNSSGNLFNHPPAQQPTNTGMPMPMPSPNNPYPKPPYTMPQPHQRYYH